jgi:hypothetical protein
MCTFQINRKENNARDGSSLSDLCCSCRVGPHHWLVGIPLLTEQKNTRSFNSHGHDGSPSLLPHLVGWIDVIVVWVWPPFTVSGALHGLDGEKAEMPSTPHIIPGVGYELSLQFSSMVQIVRCQTAHLALLIFSMLGQRLPSLTADLEAHSMPLPIMASGGHRSECSCGGSSCHDDCQPLVK